MSTSQPQRVLTSEDRYWAESAANLERTSLADVRAIAEKWRGGLTALTGIIATVLAVGAPVIGNVVVGATTRVLTGVCMVLAVLALGIATWCAMSAAFGVPDEINNDGVALQKWSATAARTAKSQLALAKILTAVGFALLLVAASIGLFASTTKTTPSTVTFIDKTELCGDLSFTNHGKTAVVTSSDGAVHEQPTADLSRVELNSGCG